MKSVNRLFAGICVTAGLALTGSLNVLAQEAPLSLSQAHVLSGGVNLTLTSPAGSSVHIMPTRGLAKALPAVQSTAGALNYHGGPIMPSIEIFTIFWVGALPTGGTAPLTAHYEAVAEQFAIDYAGHSIDNNNTQYSQTSPLSYVRGLSTAGALNSYGGMYVDTSAFPASGCTDSATPGDCITDSQLQTELQRVMTTKGWTGGFNKIYMVFTGQGEGSCFDSSGSSCAYNQYCAYHGSYTSGSTSVIYANMPYGGVPGCEVSFSPTGDLAADSVVNVSSHEVTEAITDPLLNAWWDTANGEEIGDLCAWNFGTNLYDAGKANQSWNGRFYEMQTEYDNFKSACVQNGPN